MAGLPLNQGAARLGNFVQSMSGLPYDVMEPFAATKALLGAGYQPPASLALTSRLTQQQQHASMAGCSAVCGSASATLGALRGGSLGASLGASALEQLYGAAAPAPAPAAPAACASQKPQQADGLLLLLACAGDGGGQGQSLAVASADAAPLDAPAVSA